MNAFPAWIAKTVSFDERAYRTKAVIDMVGAKTVCQPSLCPNLNECFSKGFATFLILGEGCTRSCEFCAAGRGRPSPPDREEPSRIVDAIKLLEIGHVVITSVTRDDLPDGGARQFVKTIEEICSYRNDITIELLVPDFGGMREAVELVANAKVDIFGHNIETVPRLYNEVRPAAQYRRSLDVLRWAKEKSPNVVTKSAILLGFGEEEDEVIGSMRDLRAAGCDMLAIGQYLRPSRNHISVKRFLAPEEFESYKEIAYKIGFAMVTSGPFVRSSYIV